MRDREDFLAWVESRLRDAEIALHNGDAAPRRTIWSRNDPVAVGDPAYEAYQPVSPGGEIPL